MNNGGPDLVVDDVLCATLERVAPDLLALSAALHADPEVAFEEVRSAARVRDVLHRHGMTVQEGVADLPTALTAEAGASDFVVAICAEYDALPGMGHACGHNIIAASSVGAALLLAAVAEECDLRVKLVGTPAEESGGGKILLLDAGVFDDCTIATMVHPGPYEAVVPRTLAIGDLEVRYAGRAAHAAAAPHQGINAADAMTVAQVAIGLARQHLEPGQIVHGIVTSAGSLPNTIPDSSTGTFSLRAPDLESLSRLEGRIRACFEAGAVATGATADVRRAGAPYAELQCDPTLSDLYREVLELVGRSPIPPEDEATLPPASTDMGNVSRVVPTIHPVIALDAEDSFNHDPSFAEVCRGPSADRAVYDGAFCLARTAVRAARDHDVRQELVEKRRQRGH